MRATAGIVAWHPDGRHFAIGTDHPPAVEIYDTVTRRMVACRLPESAAGSRADVQSCRRLVGDRQLGRLSPTLGAGLRYGIAAHARRANGSIVSPDDRIDGLPMAGRELQILRIARRAERDVGVALPEHKMEMRERAADRAESDGRVLAAGSSSGVSLLDVHSGLALAIARVQYPLRFDASGALLTYGADGFRRWPMQWNSTKQILRVETPQSLFNNARLGDEETSLSSDGTVAAVAGRTFAAGAVVLHQSKSGREVHTIMVVRENMVGAQNDVRAMRHQPGRKMGRDRQSRRRLPTANQRSRVGRLDGQAG